MPRHIPLAPAQAARNEAIRHAAQAGATLSDLGRAYNLTGERVRQILLGPAWRSLPPEARVAMTGADLRERRRRLGLTRPALARRLGVHVGTIAAWETGQRVPLAWNLVDLALWALEHGAQEAGHAT